MVPYETLVRRALYWAAIGLVVLNLPLSTMRVATTPRAYVPVVPWAVLAAIVVALLVACVMQVRQSRLPLAPLRVVVAISCLTLLLHPWLEGPDPEAYPPLLHVLGAGMCISAVCGIRLSVVIIGGYSGVFAMLRAQELPVSSAAGEAVLLALSGLIATACVALLQGAARTVMLAIESRRRSEEGSLRAGRRAVERERWNSLVHDKVLGALLLAVRAPGGRVPKPAKELAAEALAAFRGDMARETRPLTDIWLAQAGRLGLDVDLAVDETAPTLDPDVREALVAAVNEALTNVARHSGETKAQVSGFIRAERLRVVVSDRGRGLPDGTARHGSGIGTSIVGRMRTVGGSAEVHPGPDGGVDVLLHWERPDEAPEERATAWQLRTFAPMMILGAAAFVLNVVLGMPQWRDSRSIAVALCGIAAVATATTLITYAEPSRRNAVLCGGTFPLISTVLALNTPDGAVVDWRYWYLGALTPAAGALSFRWRAPYGSGATAAAVLAVAAVDASAGRPPWTCLTGPVPVLLGTSVAGHLLRRALDSAWSRASVATAEDADLRRRIAIEEERVSEATKRVARLASAVGPTLRLIVSADRLSAAERRRMALLEASARDQLAVPALLDAPLVESLAAARARDVTVDLISDSSTSATGTAEDHPHLVHHRALIGEALDTAEPRTRIRLVWWADDDRPRGTLTAVGGCPDGMRQRLDLVVDRLPTQVKARVSADEDAVLVEFG